MNNNDIVGLILLILFGGGGLISIFTIINLLLPLLIERMGATLESAPGRSLLLGLVNFVFSGIAVGLLLWASHIGGIVAGIVIFLAGLVGVAFIGLLLLGLVSAASLLGNRMGNHAGAGKSVARTQPRGGALLLLACLTPFLGWFIFTPLVVWTALGVAIQTIFRRQRPPESA